MTKEEKELLLKDLCARLPYGVKVGFSQSDSISFHIVNYYSSLRELEVEEENDNNYCIVKHIYPIDCYRPYLRPMSSMTEEEANEWAKASNMKFDMEDGFLDIYDAHLSIDWLNAHHFDYRGLIERGLALEAPKGMYKVE